MADHNPLQCIGWIDDRKYSDPIVKTETAICEHPGCPWSSPSIATSEQAQIAAFLAHHNHRHQEGHPTRHPPSPGHAATPSSPPTSRSG